jgi:TolB-like protein
MAEERVQIRLAAILAADVVSYTRLMDTDEAGTLSRLKLLRSEIFDPKTEEFGGRIFKNTGDGALAEFGSSVDAVQCAVEIQRALAVRNAEAREDQQLILRIGISQGDVIVDADDLFGNGVNVAARMEGLAEPGGICISGNVQEHIGNTLDIALEDLGEQSVKNIDRPVRCYRVHLEPDDATKAPSPPLPDKPSIAVLPFQNMSGDAEQEYFADGIAEDIITALSRFSWFFVIARNSSFSYKGTSPNIRRVAQELGVQYVLEGSVRKAANRVRVTAQLIDALTGRHVWAERYDRELTDIFAVQDEITSSITGAVAPSFVSAEARRIERKVPESFDAWDYAIRGNWHLWHLGKRHLAEAKRLFQAAIDLDPSSSMALSGLAMVHSYEVVWGWADDPAKSRVMADEMAQRAVAADDNDAWAHAAIANVFMHKRQNAESMEACRRALDLNPNLALAEGFLALGHGWFGDYDEAVLHADVAARLSPRDPAQAWWHLARVSAAFVTGRYEEQVEWGRKMTAATPDHPGGWRMLAVGCAYLDRMDEARAAIQQLLRLVPHITVEQVRASGPGVQPQDLDRLLEGLRKAGLPEK